MGIFSEWKINKALKKENKELSDKVKDLEETIETMNKHYKAGPIHIYLLNTIKKKNREYFILNREFERLKEWSQRILEIGQKDSAELVWVKFRYFNLLKENQITEMNLIGADRSHKFAVARFEQIREENNELKKKLNEYEGKNKVK